MHHLLLTEFCDFRGASLGFSRLLLDYFQYFLAKLNFFFFYHRIVFRIADIYRLRRAKHFWVKDHVELGMISFALSLFFFLDPLDIIDVDSLNIVILVEGLLQYDCDIKVATVVQHRLLCDDPYAKQRVLLAYFICRKLNDK